MESCREEGLHYIILYILYIIYYYYYYLFIIIIYLFIIYLFIIIYYYYYYYCFFTLGIKDPEGFGKKIGRKCVGVTITPGSPQTQRNHVAARR